MVILDTDHVSLLDHGDSAAARRLLERLDALPAADVAVTIVSFEEQTRGWMAYLAKGRSVAEQVNAYGRLRRQLDAYCRMNVLAFDDAAAVEFQHLKRSRVRVGQMDLKIAAVSLAHNATLLSRNLRDFQKIDGLRVEDWSA